MKTAEEKRAYQHAYYLLHPKPSTMEQRVAKAEYDREYSVAHKDKRMEYSRNWAADHRQYLRDYAKRYHASHKEEMADYRLSHKRERDLYNKNYAAEHPLELRLKCEKRRALKYKNTPDDELLTAAQWADILDKYNHRCAYCGTKSEHLTMDHVVALSCGGKHSKDNVVPSCRSCNSKKGTKMPEERFALSVSNEY